VFWVISVYFNIRNTLPKSGPFLLLHPVYIYIYIYIHTHTQRNFIKSADKHSGAENFVLT
jgi:hypothetical protein